MTQGNTAAANTPDGVGNIIAKCAVDFVEMARELKLELSLGQQGKSTLVTNNIRVAAIVIKRLAYRGVSIKLQKRCKGFRCAACRRCGEAHQHTAQ